MIRLLLLVLYYVVVTPIGVVFRLVRDPLRRKWNPRADSYWTFAGPGVIR